MPKIHYALENGVEFILVGDQIPRRPNLHSLYFGITDVLVAIYFLHKITNLRLIIKKTIR